MNMREEDVPEVSEENFPLQRAEAADERERDHQPRRHGRKRVAQSGKTDSAEDRATRHRFDQPADRRRSAVECDLTLSDLNLIAERFRFTLMTMLHTRIAYPKQETKITPIRDDSMRPDVMAGTRKPESAPPISAA